MLSHRWLCIAIGLLLPIPANANPVEWELRFPFRLLNKIHRSDNVKDDQSRYFKNFADIENDWSYRRKLYHDPRCKGSKEPIACSERLIGPGRIEYMHSLLKNPSTNIDILNRGRSSKNRFWISDAFITAGSQYDENLMEYRSNYIQVEPDSAYAESWEIQTRPVRVWLNKTSYKGRNCRFTDDDSGRISQIADCYIGVNSNFKRGAGSSSVLVQVLGKDENVDDEFRLSGEATFIDEVVIAAIGDSYASGEGAPDIPARVKLTEEGKIERVDPQGTHEQVGDFPNAAYWAERNCHRSYLSSQARAAIQFAVDHPKKETIFLHVACSGAEIVTGVLGTYSGAFETNQPKRTLQNEGQTWKTTLSQINQLTLALCKDPDIGNYRAGFNKYFSRVENFYNQKLGRLPDDRPYFGELICGSGFVKNINYLLVGIGGNDAEFLSVVRHVLASDPEKFVSNVVSPTVSPEDAGAIVDKNIPALLSRLKASLKKRLAMKKTKVIAATYPFGVRDEFGKYCHSAEGLSGFDIIPVIKPFVEANESKEIYSKFGLKLNKKIREASEPSWIVANEHVAKFDKHGWCAGDAKLSGVGEINAFEIRDRWINTPDDGVAFQNQKPFGKEVQRGELLNRLLMSYGMFHPNAMGAAVIADSYYAAMIGN